MLYLKLCKNKSFFKVQAPLLPIESLIKVFEKYFRTNDKKVHLTEGENEDQGSLIFSITFYKYIKQILDSNHWDYFEENNEIQNYYPKPNNLFDVSKKYFLHDDQYKIVCENIVPNYRGILQIKTGWGKSYLISYLNKVYKGTGKKLVMTNNNQVRDTLILRAKELGVDMENVRIINPVAFCSSNAFKDENERNWFKDVELIQIDESESVPPSTKAILDLCENKKVIYGYSASPEKVKGINLSTFDVIPKVNSDCFQVLKHIGFSVYYIEPKKKIDLNIIRTDMIKDEKFPHWIANSDSMGAISTKQRISQKNLFNDDVIFKAIDYILTKKKKTLYIPYKFKEHGDLIYNHYEKSDKSIIQWDGSKLRSNKFEVTDIESIRTRLLSDSIDLFIASSVSYRGVDFRNIFDIFFFISTQFNDVTQIVGRGAREGDDISLNVWLLENIKDNTPFYSIMHRSRKKKFLEIFKANENYVTMYNGVVNNSEILSDDFIF